MKGVQNPKVSYIMLLWLCNMLTGNLTLDKGTHTTKPDLGGGLTSGSPKEPKRVAHQKVYPLVLIKGIV